MKSQYSKINWRFKGNKLAEKEIDRINFNRFTDNSNDQISLSMCYGSRNGSFKKASLRCKLAFLFFLIK